MGSAASTFNPTTPTADRELDRKNSGQVWESLNDTESNSTGSTSPRFTPTINEFDMEEVIGQGGFGKVWKARLSSTGETFAVKIQNLAPIRDKPDKLEQIRRERRILETLQSPFIVHLHWALENHDSVFLVLDLIPGGTLFQLQSKQPKARFTELQTAFYIMETFVGLTHLHKERVCFRDLKPENLLIDARGHVVLTDFGLSRQEEDINFRHQSVLGTPEYMAPEIIQSGQGDNLGYSFEVDYWALGCLMYECLHSYSPFTAGSIKETFVGVLQGKFHPFSNKTTLAAKSLVTGLLKVDPVARFGAEFVRPHEFFESHFTWEEIETRSATPPIVPALSSIPAEEIAKPEYPEDTPRTTFQQSLSDRTQTVVFRSGVWTVSKASESTGDASCGTPQISAPAGKLALLGTFVRLYSESCLDREQWRSVLDECFMYVLPSTVYRNQVGAFSDGGHQKVLVGIDSFIQDLNAGLQPLSHIRNGKVTGRLMFTVDETTILQTERGLVWAGFVQSAHVPARTTVIISMQMSNENRITKIHQAMDVLGFGKQLQAFGNQEEDVPVDDCRPISITDFRILGSCGQGQFGVVWKARVAESWGLVAIKSQPQHNLTGKQNTIIEEQKIHGKMKHPFITELLGTFHSNDQFFMVMDYASRGSLFDLQESYQIKALPLMAVRFYVSEIAVALDHIHDQGVVFRDLKPENVLIQESGHIKLTDFGCAINELEFRVDSATHLGCLEYTAPEVLLQKLCGPSVDWWALGCLAFELVSGFGPFCGEDIIECHENITSGKRPHMPNVKDRPFISLVDLLLKVQQKERLGPRGLRSHAFFRGLDWQAVSKSKNQPWKPAHFDDKRESSDVFALSANSDPGTWQLRLAQTFFDYHTACNTNPAEWAEVVDDVFVLCTPNLPYRNMAASKVDPSTQLHFVIGVQELVRDMEFEKGSQAVNFEFTLVPGKFHANEEQGIAALSITAGNVMVTGATKMTFSTCRKRLTRVETCFDVHALMSKLDGLASKPKNMWMESYGDRRRLEELLDSARRKFDELTDRSGEEAQRYQREIANHEAALAKFGVRVNG